VSTSASDYTLAGTSDFSLVAGGPLYQLLRRLRLSGEGLQLVRRRVAFLTTLAWVPLLALSIAEGHAWGSSVSLTFLKDLETHAKLLIAVPLLIAAEFKVHQRLPFVARQFLERGIITAAVRPQFDAAVASARRLRNSVVAELILLLVVYVVGISLIWRTQSAVHISSWYGVPGGSTVQLSHAGWWATCVSLPMVQFLALRWYYRLFIWGRFLWQVSRMPLKLVATHPDGTAGLHFLTQSGRIYTLLLLAEGTILAGVIANRIFYTGATLLSFKVELLTTAAVMLLVVLAPVLAFTPALRATRRAGLDALGVMGQRYAGGFEHKWFRGGAAPGEEMLGSSDIQSLADLRGSYLIVKGIDYTPLSVKNVLELVLITLAPVAPLLLTTFSLSQLFEQVLRVVF
jgi:hypothetical protein